MRSVTTPVRVAAGLISPILSLVLVIFSLRRALYTLAMLIPRVTTSPRLGGSVRHQDDGLWPHILVLVPCRDEENLITGLCESLRALDYPHERLRVVLIDDGSRDSTARMMEEQARGRAGWSVLSLPHNVGKARALNAALARHSFGDIIYVFDADHRPRRDALRRAISYLDDPATAGMSGRTVPVNALAGVSSYYASVENAVHQMVTMRGKDRLDLGPALLGSNCAYRRDALSQLGGFRPGALLEDYDLTYRFYLAGYRVRFAEDVISYQQVPETVGGYVRQHVRWSRGFHAVARDYGLMVARDGRLSVPLRMELIVTMLGYLDRLAFLGAIVLACASAVTGRKTRFLYPVLNLAVATPLVQILALFVEQRYPFAMWLRLPLVPLFFLGDIVAAAMSTIQSLSRRPQVWTKTERSRALERTY